MNVSKVMLCRKATNVVTSEVRWSVIFKDDDRVYQIDGLRQTDIPKMKEVCQHVRAHPELVRPVITISRIKNGVPEEGYTFLEPLGLT